LFDCLEHELGFKEVVTLLLSDAENGATCLHIAAMSRKKSFLKCLVFFLKETIGPGNFRLMLQRKNAFGETILHVAVKQRNCGTFLYLIEVLTSEFGKKFVDEMLQRTSHDDKTILQLAIEGNESNQSENCKKFLQFLLKLLQGRLNFERYMKVLTNMDNNGHYLIHVAVKLGRQQLFEFLALQLVPAIFEMMVSSSDVLNSNIGLLAIENCGLELVELVFARCGLSVIHQRLWDEKSAIHLAVQAKDDRNLDFVMESWDQESLWQKDTNHRNIFHMAATQPSRFLKVLDCVDSDVDLSDMLSEKDKDGLNPLHVVVKCQRRLTISDIFEYLQERLGKENFAKLLLSTTSARENILHLAAEYSNALTLEMLIEKVGCELDHNQLFKALLLAKNEKLQTLLLIAAKKGNPSMVSLLLSEYSSYLDKEQWQEMLTAQTRQGANLLLFAVQANNMSLFERFIDLLRETNGNNMVRDQLLIRSKLEFPLTVLASAVYNCDLPFIMEIRKILEETFAEAELRLNFFNKGFFNYVIVSSRKLVIKEFFEICKDQNRLDVELKNLKYEYFAECSAPVIEDLIEMIKTELGVEEFRNFMVNIKFIFVSVRNGSKSKIAVVLKILSENLDGEAMHKMLTAKEPDTGFNVVLYAAHYLDTTVVEFLIAALRPHLSAADIEELLCQEGDDGSKILHNRIRGGSKREIRATFDFLLRHLSDACLSKMVLALTKRRNNTMHVAMIHCSPPTINWLLEFLETIVTREQIDTMLKQKSNRGSYLLHHAVKANEHFIVPFVHGMLQRRFDVGMAERMLHVSNKIHQNVVYISGLYGSTSTFKHLTSYLMATSGIAKRLPDSGNLLAELRAKDNNQESILMCAARNPDVRMFSVVADFLFKMLPKEEVKGMLCASNKNGLTLLHIIASDQLKFDEYFEYLLDKLGKIEFLQARNKKGYSAVEAACRREEDIALENFMEWMNKIDSGITKELVAEVLMKFTGIRKSKKNILLNYQ
jgi:ankyrin repeat protein